jgi:Ca-activated chloride channel family protein
MKAVIELWKKRKKHANVVLVLDTSGSMQGEKMANAKLGAQELVRMLGEEDVLSLLPFSDRLNWAGQGLRMADGRDKASSTIGTYYAEGGTALYAATAEANRYLLENPTPDMITAIVVLSDGEDTSSTIDLGTLLSEIRTDNETRSTRVFTIGYGAGASEAILEQIADATGAKFFHGTPETIREVFKEISTFF